MQTISLENKRGFTLIELVIVIVLIGILAATALPKFANLTTQARTAANQGFAGGLGAAVSIAHAAWIASGQTTNGSVVLETTTVNMNSAGWPGGGTGPSAPTNPQDCANLIGQAGGTQGILNNPPLISGEGCPPTAGVCYLATVASQVCTYQLYNSGTVVSGVTVTYNGTNGTVTAAP